MKTVKDFINEVHKQKVFKEFPNSYAALDWITNDIKPNEYGVADIILKIGKVGTITTGFDINDKSEDLILHVDGVDGKFINLSKEYKGFPWGEFCDCVDDLIRKYGDRI